MPAGHAAGGECHVAAAPHVRRTHGVQLAAQELRLLVGVAAIAFLLVVQVVGTSATMTTAVCRRPQSPEATRPEMEERNSGWRR